LNRFIIGRLLPVFLIASGSAVAAPPAVGDKAPDFVLETLQGKKIRMYEGASDKPIVLVVLRGYPGYQCPLCNRQAQDFIQNGAALEGAAGRVVLVYPGPSAGLKARAEEFLSGKSFPKNFDLVLDPGYEFTTLYDLRWNAPRETAYPSTFIIDPRGVVIFSHISKSHGGRVKAADILAALRKTKHYDR
jgi:thioredoxin-dependent peroxiredoxin